MRANRALPMTFPVIIEEIDDKKHSNAPKIEKITAKNVDRIIELVQEFLRGSKYEHDRSNIERMNDFQDPDRFQDELRATSLDSGESDIDFSDLPEREDHILRKISQSYVHNGYIGMQIC